MTVEEGARVLVVEDDEVVGAVLFDTLVDEGYAVRLVADGRAALITLEEWPPDLILLDLMMPGMDGYAFRAAQRSRREVATVPVVVLSARHDVVAQTAGFEAAAVVTKPFQLETIVSTVRRCLDSTAARRG